MFDGNDNRRLYHFKSSQFARRLFVSWVWAVFQAWVVVFLTTTCCYVYTNSPVDPSLANRIRTKVDHNVVRVTLVIESLVLHTGSFRFCVRGHHHGFKGELASKRQTVWNVKNMFYELKCIILRRGRPVVNLIRCLTVMKLPWTDALTFFTDFSDYVKGMIL